MSDQRRPKRGRRRLKKSVIIVGIAIIVAIIAVIVILAVNSKNKKVEEPELPSAPEIVHTDPVYTHADIPITDEDPIPSDNTNFLIKVNTALNVTVVYSKDENGNLTPIRAIPCSTAREGYETPIGDFWLCEWIIKPANEWCYMADGTEGLYAYRITDGDIYSIMFHSVPYLETDHSTLEWEEYNKLGGPASMGCMRMACSDVRWLGETCGNNTDIEIYNDPNEQFPIPVPTPIRIPAEVEEIRGWDPTDPSSENPWHTYTITMDAPDSVEIQKDDSAYLNTILSNVKIIDQFGHDLSSYAEVNGNIDVTKAGYYPVELKAVIGPVTATKQTTIIIKED